MKINILCTLHVMWLQHFLLLKMKAFYRPIFYYLWDINGPKSFHSFSLEVFLVETDCKMKKIISREDLYQDCLNLFLVFSILVNLLELFTLSRVGDFYEKQIFYVKIKLPVLCIFHRK